MNFGNQNRSNSLIINMIFETADLKTQTRLVSKLQCYNLKITIFMKFGTQNKWNMLINDVDPNLKICEFGAKTKMCSNFHEIWRQSKENMLIMNIVLGIDDLLPKLQIRVNLVPKLNCIPIFMKFGTHIFKFTLTNLTNLIKELRNVKTLKSFFSGGLLCTQSDI